MCEPFRVIAKHTSRTLTLRLVLVLALFALSAFNAPATLHRSPVSGTLQKPPQPDAKTTAIISRAFTDVSAGQRSRFLGPSQDAMIWHDGLPYFKYNSLKGTLKYVFHPMRMGHILQRNATVKGSADLVHDALRAATRLPNGGLAWYYPAHYNVSRMLGPYLKYSTISQGSILSGLTDIGRANKSVGPGPARAAFIAMMWPYENGGVNLANRALLEMPSFTAPPEIILNGWLDALLNVRYYVAISGDEEARRFLTRSLKFLSEVLPNFDAPEAGLSRYSDLSPYKVRVTLQRPEDIETLQVEYRPKRRGIPPISILLHRTANSEDWSPYDNQIWQQSDRVADVWVSCSRLYETLLTADSERMTVELATGILDRKRSTPGDNGKHMMLQSKKAGSGRSISLDEIENKLICGYPTNFSKPGDVNFYHVYHVVSLLLLGMTMDPSNNVRPTLIDWALKWHHDMIRMQKSEGVKFEDPEKIFAHLRRNLAIDAYTDFDALLRAAEDTRERLPR